MKRRAGLRALLAFGVVAAGVLGCAPELAAPPRAPKLAAPGDALPADLDCVLRVDLARVRSALGADTLRSLRQSAALTATDLAEGWIAEAVEQSDVAVVAFRPELAAGGPDNVIVLRGRFSGVKPPQSAGGWGPAVDLGGDVRRFDRRGEVPRSSPVRLYAFADEGLVFVSAAEIDSVEAVIEGGREAGTVRPPARGVLAFSARLRGARRALNGRFPILAAALGDARGLEGSLDPRTDGFSAELALELNDEAQATRAADLARALAGSLAVGEGRWAALARAATVEAAGRFAVLRLALGRDQLGLLLLQAR